MGCPQLRIASPKYANIMGYLELERQAKRFAEGGPTTGTMPAPSINALSKDNASEVRGSIYNMLNNNC